MAKSQQEISIEAAILVDEGLVRRIADVIGSFGEVRCDVVLSDGTHLSDLSVDEALKVSNGRTRKIKQISFSAGTYQRGATVRIRDAWIIPISITVRGDDKEVVACTTELKRIIEDKKNRILSPVYNIASNAHVAVMGLIVAGTLIWAKEWGAKLTTDVSTLDILFMLGGLVWAVVSVSLLLGWMFTTLFPRVVMYIGDGIDRYDRLVKGRNFVLASILLSVVLGVVGNAIYDAVKSG